MYCPNCGSNNQAGIRFCTRCGTNLAVVSEALSGKAADHAPADDRIVKLLKDYYRGRRATFLGAPLFACGVIMLTGFFVANLPDSLSALFLLPLISTVYGAISSFWGISHWMDSSSELKALGYDNLKMALPRPAQSALAQPPVEIETARSKVYATDPIEPGSVTEQTTNLLEERDAVTHREIRPKQIS